MPSSDDAGLSGDLGLDINELSSVSTDPGPSFSSLDPPPSDKPEALLRPQQIALKVDSSASAPPPASQDDANPECDKSPKGKRETGGVETPIPVPETAQQAPKTTPEE